MNLMINDRVTHTQMRMLLGHDKLSSWVPKWESAEMGLNIVGDVVADDGESRAF